MKQDSIRPYGKQYIPETPTRPWNGKRLYNGCLHRWRRGENSGRMWCGIVEPIFDYVRQNKSALK